MAYEFDTDVESLGRRSSVWWEFPVGPVWTGGDMKFMKFMDANGAKIEFLISEKSDFDLKVGFFF